MESFSWPKANEEFLKKLRENYDRREFYAKWEKLAVDLEEHREKRRKFLEKFPENQRLGVWYD